MLLPNSYRYSLHPMELDLLALHPAPLPGADFRDLSCQKHKGPVNAAQRGGPEGGRKFDFMGIHRISGG